MMGAGFAWVDSPPASRTSFVYPLFCTLPHVSPPLIQPTNKEYYRQKTDFTVWADQKVKYAATMPS